jgi:3-oxoacyl-[acyl-carrier protein] reductase
MRYLDQRVAIVTGASKGIGKATAIKLAEAGASVVLAARGKAELQTAADEIIASGGDALVVPTDVTDESQAEKLILTAIQKYGKIDILVNNAGSGTFASVLESKISDWDQIIAVNLRAVYLCSKFALKFMLERGSGHIVNVISIAAKVAFKNASAYCTAKAGALHFTKVLAEEVRDKNIRVTAICPGSVDTPFWQQIDPKPDLALMLKPEHVAESILYVVNQPQGMVTDEITITPPLGIL